MYYLFLVITAAWMVLPALAQQPGLPSGSQGIINEQAIRNAVRNALQKSLNIQEVVPVGSRPPSRLTARKRVTVSMSTECAVPLLRVPSGGGSDDIVLNRGIWYFGQRHGSLSPNSPLRS